MQRQKSERLEQLADVIKQHVLGMSGANHLAGDSEPSDTLSMMNGWGEASDRELLRINR